MTVNKRSYEKIVSEDLQKLGDIARFDRQDFFKRHPHYKVLEDKLLAVALCQGAALHYIDGKNGVKDFDVWTFYAKHDEVEFPPRRYIARDFADPKFGTSQDSPHFIGRRVDLLGRSLNIDKGIDPIVALRNYLSKPKTASSKALAKKAVVLIEPEELLGVIVWPINGST